MTKQELQAKINDIDNKIDELIANPQIDYRIGDISVSASQKLAQLREIRQVYQELLGSIGEDYIPDKNDEV